MTSERARNGGFTLLEAMVALIIVALGMMAVNSQLNRYASASFYVEQKALASWIASNKITELSVAPTWPELGDSDEEIEFAGQLWHCRVEVQETPVENLRRIDVEIALVEDPERVLHRMMGLVEPPIPAGFAPVQWFTSPAGGGPDDEPGSSFGRRDRGRGDRGGNERGADEPGRDPPGSDAPGGDER